MYETRKVQLITNPKVAADNIHGTGCNLSSSITAYLSLGDAIDIAIIKGCNYVNKLSMLVKIKP